ncbi:uncharacterized protein LOC110769375 [Prunus avium]|uniref:Uncharacterized protein LOC110769375 n=1 Tax=Prunus avium TaxID=42229 RepID=A0A6P5TPR0_PRUAV|nr:uncharacterized protein LOC110769375 [Prunus avium]
MVEAERELFPGTNGLSVLTVMVRLMQAKVENHWTNKSFDILLEILNWACPKPHNFPTTYYATNKMLKNLGLGYENIDACVNDCALFYKEHVGKDKCPECDEPRYKSSTNEKRKKVPQKVLRYFPLKPRLQRMFMSKHTASQMRWHFDKRVDEYGVMRHPADSIAWKEFDRMYPEFAQEPRNIRLGLATDGFNPFGSMSTSYSMWPVVVVPYNLPPWMCMKQQYSIMTLLIPGPKAPGKDIDVYLRPLIDELKELWEGVPTYDKFTDSGFKMRATVIWTINDFPAYGNLSGWSTKGYLACPVCLEDTSHTKLRNKICYMGHRRYLRKNHPWRKSCDFDGKYEMRDQPRVFSGDEILLQFNHLRPCKPGKHPDNYDRKRKRMPMELNWTKKSIFFELEYWSKLKIRHNLDVMHIEKNICDNIVGTLLSIEGKTKDTINARLDMIDMNIRRALHLHRDETNLVKKYPAIYTLLPHQRQSFCEFLKSVKFPDGYAANISKNVKEDGKISGLKSHDCHVLLQQLLPVGIRPYLPKEVCAPLMELSYFFQQICAKTLKVEDLDRLEVDIVFILCKLEKIFPPAFFDVMVHLAIHLPREAKLAGPVAYRWMYPIERMLGKLKGYVRNRARPEGSIVEGYIANESLTFCSMYLRNGEIFSSHHERNNDGGETNAKLSVFMHNARPCGGYKMVQWSELEMESAYWYILNNCDEVEPFKNEFRQLLEIESPDNLEQRQRKLFPQWLKTRVKTLSKQGLGDATNELYALAYGPDKRVGMYTGCVVNGVRWQVKHIEETRTTQNSGVMVPGTHGDQQSNFYGRLVNVVKIGFQDGYHVILFKCEWFNTQPRFFRKKKIHRIRRDYHLTSVNTTNVWYKDDPYVLAKQAQQIFYLDDPKLGSSWKVIQKIRHRHVWDVPENEAAHEVETIYDEGVDQDGDDIVITSRDENELPSTSLRRDDAEPEIVEEEISLEPIGVDDYEEVFTDDESIEEQLSRDESNSVHSDDYSDLD